VPSKIRYRYQDISEPNTQRKLEALLRERDADVFCLNDTDSDPAMFERQMALLGRFLERYYPLRSTFEKP
jgi:hypothetical protein